MSDSDDDVNDNKQLKLVFLGESTVGKTSLIRRLCYDDFTRHYNQTIGAEFHLKNLMLPGKKEIKIRITDIGGHELTGQMLKNYLFNSNVIVIVYDITNTASFDSLILWFDNIKKILGNSAKLAIFGNKSDLEHKRAVRLDKTQQFVNEYRVVNYLVSAKTGENVNLSLNDITAKYFCLSMTKTDRSNRPPVITTDSVSSQEDEKESKTSLDKLKRNSVPHETSSVCCLQ